MRALTFAAILATGLAPIEAGAQDAPAAAGRPADLCQELVTFVKPPAAPPAPSAGNGAKTDAAVQAPEANKTAALPNGGAGEVQQKSGISGPVPQDGPDSGKTNPHAKANAAAKAPAAAGAPKPAPKPDAAMIAQVETAAQAGDPTACRAAAQRMRRAGVGMPAPLLALSALDPALAAPASPPAQPPSQQP